MEESLGPQAAELDPLPLKESPGLESQRLPSIASLRGRHSSSFASWLVLAPASPSGLLGLWLEGGRWVALMRNDHLSLSCLGCCNWGKRQERIQSLGLLEALEDYLMLRGCSPDELGGDSSFPCHQEASLTCSWLMILTLYLQWGC